MGAHHQSRDDNDPVEADRCRRLAEAVRDMQDAQAELKSNVALYQCRMASLQDSVQSLGWSMSGYQQALNRLNFQPLRRHALRLAEIADGWACLEKQTGAAVTKRVA